jgi:predicted nucleic acid-binding Zn ribbon protein
MSDEPLKECVLCNSSGVRRVVNSVGIVFKGNGFYVTDTRAKNSAATSTGSTTTESTSTEKKSVPPESSGNGSAKPETPPAAP